MQGLMRIAPVTRRAGKVAVDFERQLVQLVGFVVCAMVGDGHFAGVDAYQVNHFVFENPDQPGFQLRPISES